MSSFHSREAIAQHQTDLSARLLNTMKEFGRETGLGELDESFLEDTDTDLKQIALLAIVCGLDAQPSDYQDEQETEETNVIAASSAFKPKRTSASTMMKRAVMGAFGALALTVPASHLVAEHHQPLFELVDIPDFKTGVGQNTE